MAQFLQPVKSEQDNYEMLPSPLQLVHQQHSAVTADEDFRSKIAGTESTASSGSQ